MIYIYIYIYLDTYGSKRVQILIFRPKHIPYSYMGPEGYIAEPLGLGQRVATNSSGCLACEWSSHYESGQCYYYISPGCPFQFQASP